MKNGIRVAVIFFGQPRFVENGLAAKSHKWWLRGAEVDYFGHCWFDEVSLHETAPWANLGSISMHPSSIEIIREQYQGIRLAIDKPEKFDIEYLKSRLNISEREILSPELIREIGNLSNTASQFLSIHRAINTFEQSFSSSKYDLLILSRFDNFIWAMDRPAFLPSDKLTLSNHHDGFPDLIFAGTLEHLKALDAWPDFENLIRGERTLSAESLKRKSFLRHFSISDLHPVFSDVTILRSNSFRYLIWTLPSMRVRRVLQINSRLKRLFSYGRSKA